jgi:hypothetical protein
MIVMVTVLKRTDVLLALVEVASYPVMNYIRFLFVFGISIVSF